MSKKNALSHLIYGDPAYSDLIRIVGYGEVRFPLGKAEQDRLLAAHGKEKMIRVANELIEYDPKTKLVKLKAEVRDRCQMMLGPPPEEWDAFYANVVHPPPNPYRPKSTGAPQSCIWQVGGGR